MTTEIVSDLDQRNHGDARSIMSAAWAGIVLLWTASFAAAGPVHIVKTVATLQAPIVTIHNVRGSVVVRAWDRNVVRAVCDLASHNVELATRRTPLRDPAARVEFVIHEASNRVATPDEECDYVINVPQYASVEIRNPEGSVRLEGIRGDATVNSINGTVYVSDSRGHLHVETVIGNVEIVRPSGRVEALSVLGDLHFLDPACSRLTANTTSGKIIYEGGFVAGGDYELKDYSGEIDILSPITSSFELDAHTVRGKVLNSFPMKPQRRIGAPFGQGSSFVGTSNAGAALVEATSFSGEIHVDPTNSN